MKGNTNHIVTAIVEDVVSSWSFDSLEKARDFIVSEVLECDDGTIDEKDIVESLETKGEYSDGNTKYYLKEVK